MFDAHSKGMNRRDEEKILKGDYSSLTDMRKVDTQIYGLDMASLLWLPSSVLNLASLGMFRVSSFLPS